MRAQIRRWREDVDARPHGLQGRHIALVSGERMSRSRQTAGALYDTRLVWQISTTL